MRRPLRHEIGPPLRLPAFGRELVALRLRGLVPGRTVVVSLDSWRWGRAFCFYQLVISAELNPLETDFCMIAGLDTILAWSSRVTTIARRDAVIRSVARSMPLSLWVVDMVAPEESFFVASRSRGIERPEYFE